MAAGRPFSSHSVDQLAAMMTKAQTDSVLREALAKELSQRKTAKAKALASRVAEMDSQSDVEINVNNGESVTARSLHEDLELLRATFSEPGEILARWGMTESMPRDMRDEVFRLWRERLQTGDQHLGRTSTRLAETVSRLGHLDAALTAQPGLGASTRGTGK